MSAGRFYQAERLRDGSVSVMVRHTDHDLAYSLRPRLDLRDHGWPKFAWGEKTGGVLQLALAILADLVGDDHALNMYHAFALEVLVFIKTNAWSMEERFVFDHLSDFGPSTDELKDFGEGAAP